MDFSKIKNKLLICLCCVVLILPFYLITFTYASEDSDNITLSVINDRVLSGSSQSIVSNDNYDLYYLELESGYTYYIDIDIPADARYGFSNSLDVGSSIYNYVYYESATTLQTVIDGDTSNYLFFDFSLNNQIVPSYTIRKVANTSYSNAVTNLVDNVGINQIWDVFDISINYIVVVVLFAFGCFIIFRVIKKLSKGKEGL